ncbi:hypothetical protein EON65_11560 [archaeon]|nr:MAG: hypothetical protein EON65_11560 [archaeon]
MVYVDATRSTLIRVSHHLVRRTTYTRSLAVMSMVGYILGLGDRHPSNLMLDRKTGKILHIDFGDCFEVATYRDKYPEKVPFRLTRMLVNAMEVARIEGMHIPYTLHHTSHHAPYTIYTSSSRQLPVYLREGDGCAA